MSQVVDVVLFHAGCMDGFTAAWLLARTHKPAAVVPVSYSETDTTIKEIIEQCRDAHVVMTDVSFPREQMESLEEVSASLTVIDHHATAPRNCGQIDGLTLIFDPHKSAARLVWEFVWDDAIRHSEELRRYFAVSLRDLPPSLVAYVEDYDLWQFRLPSSEAINRFLRGQEKAFANWDRLHQMMSQSVDTITMMLTTGKALLADDLMRINQAVARAGWCRLFGHVVPTVNLTESVIHSKVGQVLAAGHPFAASYQIVEDRVIFSLRSAESGLDVAELAASMPGGGGHKHAAGFNCDLKAGLELIAPAKREDLDPEDESLEPEDQSRAGAPHEDRG